jgi:hypothetical protein
MKRLLNALEKDRDARAEARARKGGGWGLAASLGAPRSLTAWLPHAETIVLLVPLVVLAWGLPVAPFYSEWLAGAGALARPLCWPDCRRGTVSVLGWFAMCQTAVREIRRLLGLGWCQRRA